MARYFTADLHLGHRKIIDYCNRPFPDADEMNAVIIDRWNATVGADDEVIVLGDVAMGRIGHTLSLIAQLNGRKVLLAGNHDRCWSGHRKGVDTATARYHDAGFDEVWQGTVTLDVGGADVLACHFPYRGGSHDAAGASSRHATATSPTAPDDHDREPAPSPVRCRRGRGRARARRG